VGIGPEDFIPHVGGEAVVNAKHHHERANADSHAQNGHDRYDVDECLLSPRKEVAQGNE